MPQALPVDVQNDLKAMLINEIPYSIISSRLNLSKSTISSYSNKWFPNRNRNLGGRPIVVADKTKSLIKKMVLSGQLLTATDVQRMLSNLGYELTVKTSANVLKSMNFFSAIKKKEATFVKKASTGLFKLCKKIQKLDY